MVGYDALLFILKIETETLGTNSMPFLVFQRDHLRSTLGIICGQIWGSFPVWGSFVVGDHLRRCKVIDTEFQSGLKIRKQYGCRYEAEAISVK